MITLKNVTKIYGKQFKAVNNLSLEIKNGEIFGFLGPNGAGKTTALNMIVGITTISEGEIFVDDINVATNSVAAKLNVGFVPDDPNSLLRLTGREYLSFIASIYKIDPYLVQERIESLSKTFELDHALADRIETYSHGMRQKLLVIGVLLHNPNNWILDEPLTGLDPKSSFDLKAMMRTHADQGKTVLFSTHVLEVAEKVCDRVAIINKGQLLFVGTVSELRAQTHKNQSLEQLFLELTSNE